MTADNEKDFLNQNHLQIDNDYDYGWSSIENKSSLDQVITCGRFY